MPAPHSTAELLRLTLVEGVGPILGRRLLAAFGSPDAIFTAAAADLERIEGIGPTKARRIHASILDSALALDRELELAAKLGVRMLAFNDSDYPSLLAEAPDAPLILYYKGPPPCPTGSYPVAIVGSRHCTPYGIEQAERFSMMLAQQGLVIVSGGARGIDSAAHRAALRVKGTTIVVMGCGLANCYPPENLELFNQVAAEGGTILSELPLSTGPTADNFPARNRVIAAMSLGVLVIEAPAGSGALITARVAIDDYNRDVFAVPGRVDSRASEGSNALIKAGEAAMVTAPADIIALLEASARYHHEGSHADRYAAHTTPSALPPSIPEHQTRTPIAILSETQNRIVEALSEPGSLEELCRRTSLDPALVQADITVLQIRKVIVRNGSQFAVSH